MKELIFKLLNVCAAVISRYVLEAAVRKTSLKLKGSFVLSHVGPLLNS
jgi:hypothetical protein